MGRGPVGRTCSAETTSRWEKPQPQFRSSCTCYPPGSKSERWEDLIRRYKNSCGSLCICIKTFLLCEVLSCIRLSRKWNIDPFRPSPLQTHLMIELIYNKLCKEQMQGQAGVGRLREGEEGKLHGKLLYLKSFPMVINPMLP